MEEPGAPRPTVEQLQSLTVVKLRQRLAQYGIPQSGKMKPFHVALIFTTSNKSGKKTYYLFFLFICFIIIYHE